LVEPFIEIEPQTPPPMNHGTHVAGIIGASKAAALAHG
jgi:subtilisin family serine protease